MMTTLVTTDGQQQRGVLATPLVAPVTSSTIYAIIITFSVSASPVLYIVAYTLYICYVGLSPYIVIDM